MMITISHGVPVYHRVYNGAKRQRHMCVSGFVFNSAGGESQTLDLLIYDWLNTLMTLETIKRQTRAAYGWLVVGQSVGAGMVYGL